MSKCFDFVNKEKDLGISCDGISKVLHSSFKILFTPGFHCELTEEGIEYAWVTSKRINRWQPIKKKQSIANFKSLVTLLLNQITNKMTRRLSANAQGYMLAYSQNVFEDNYDNDTIKKEWNFEQNEKIQKMYRFHRDVNVTDGQLIEQVLRVDIYKN